MTPTKVIFFLEFQKRVLQLLVEIRNERRSSHTCTHQAVQQLISEPVSSLEELSELENNLKTLQNRQELVSLSLEVT